MNYLEQLEIRSVISNNKLRIKSWYYLIEHLEKDNIKLEKLLEK